MQKRILCYKELESIKRENLRVFESREFLSKGRGRDGDVLLLWMMMKKKEANMHDNLWQH